jgi:hypothetical protein
LAREPLTDVACDAGWMAVATRAVVIVEGPSDRMALETLALRHGRDLAAEGVAVASIGGATNIRKALTQYGPDGLDLTVAGLCDVGEEDLFRRGLERTGLGAGLDRAGMEALGFYVCVVDLEDELIRALGAEAVEAVIDAQGQLGSFRTLQKQVAQQGRPHEAQLRRFFSARSGAKLRYARLLVAAVDLSRVPRPLDRVLERVLT